MKIKLSQFGTMLISRPAGREAFLAAKAYSLSDQPHHAIEVDFSGVKVMTPSWLDEFLTPLRKEYGDKVTIVNANNPSVFASLATISRK